MLNIILVDTALELIPPAIQNSNSVQNNLKRLGNAGKILDTALHHADMAQLSNHEKRGRPDILHHFILDALGSLANLNGQLRIFFHTPYAFFQVSSKLHCPRDQLRFKALMAQLLELGHIPPTAPYFIEKIPETLTHWIETRFDPSQILKLTSHGTQVIYNQLFSSPNPTHEWLVLIGGFQKGSFSTEIVQLPGQSYAIASIGLESWTVVNRVIVTFETNIIQEGKKSA
jgi:rRNA small subunit pseudouridine methyltransferase Nep1